VKLATAEILDENSALFISADDIEQNAPKRAILAAHSN